MDEFDPWLRCDLHLLGLQRRSRAIVLILNSLYFLTNQPWLPPHRPFLFFITHTRFTTLLTSPSSLRPRLHTSSLWSVPTRCLGLDLPSPHSLSRLRDPERPIKTTRTFSPFSRSVLMLTHEAQTGIIFPLSSCRSRRNLVHHVGGRRELWLVRKNLQC